MCSITRMPRDSSRRLRWIRAYIGWKDAQLWSKLLDVTIWLDFSHIQDNGAVVVYQTSTAKSTLFGLKSQQYVQHTTMVSIFLFLTNGSKHKYWKMETDVYQVETPEMSDFNPEVG